MIWVASGDEEELLFQKGLRDSCATRPILTGRFDEI